jgi:hypothetical protein
MLVVTYWLPYQGAMVAVVQFDGFPVRVGGGSLTLVNSLD